MRIEIWGWLRENWPSALALWLIALVLVLAFFAGIERSGDGK